MRRVIGLSGLALLLVLLGCGPREEPAKEKQPTSQQQYLTQQQKQGEQLKEEQITAEKKLQEQEGEPSGKETMKQYQKEAEDKLADIDKKIAELKDKAASASARTRAKINKAIKNSDTLFKNTKQKLEQLKEASADKWENLKGEIDKAFERLQKRYEEAKAYLK